MFRCCLSVTCIFFAGLLSAQVDHYETVVYEDDTWKYRVPSGPVPTNWITVGYNDVAWSTGPGGFGMGDGDDNTTLPAGTVSVYQRILFTITDVSAVEKMIFNIDYDDAFVAYINGVEICRADINSAGQPSFDQLADNLHEAQLYAGGSPFQKTLFSSFVDTYLVNGTNVLCVQTHNQNAGSSDLSSRVWLSLGINNTSTDYGPVPAWFIPPVELQTSNLPIVVVNTGGVQIVDEPKIDATMGIIYNGAGVLNSVNDPYNEFSGDISIEIRGSSSGGFDMKSYGLETRGPMDQNYNVSIFDWPEDNDWILYAPYNDKSLLRNVLTYKLGNEFGSYAPRTQLCEVVLNGEYQGVYVFMERIKQNPGRVNINELNYEDISGNELTGGYVLKVDKTTGGDPVAWTSPYTCAAPGTGPIEILAHDPVFDSLHPLQLQYIQDYFTDWEDALAGPDFADPVLGYAPFIDEYSFIDFTIMNELSKNVDGYRISTFLYKERLSEGGELVAGPLWDFNLAWGNADYCEGWSMTGWELDFNSICGGSGGLQNPFWFGRLLEDPQYARMMNCRWWELREDVLNLDSILNYIDSMAVYLDDAAIRNYATWPILGVYLWPNNFVGSTYAEEIGYLKDWITGRITWMDYNMFGTCPDFGFGENAVVENPIVVIPNPVFAGSVVELPGSISNGRFVVTNMLGELVRTESFDEQQSFYFDRAGLPAGIYHIEVFDGETSIGITRITLL
jgi:hypothetical protein